MAGPRVNGVESTDARTEGDDFPIIGSPVESEGDGGIPIIDPGTLKSDPSDGSPRRGRARGRTAAAPKQSAKETQADLTSILLSIHFMLAKIADVDALELDESEAKKLADACARVQREFGVAIMSPKVAAIINLLMVGGGVYGPRAVAVAMHAKKKKEAKAHRGVGVTLDAEVIQ